MTDLTRGYLGAGKGDLGVVQAIFEQSPLNVGLPAQWLARAFFTNNFMPYAKTHWRYDGRDSNCDDLANAFLAAWNYLKVVKRPAGLDPLPLAGKISGVPDESYFITRPLPVFAGPARGNVRAHVGDPTDGRCMFPVHWVAKVGLMHFDPTFDRITANTADIVERGLTKLTPVLLMAKDKSRLYVRNLDAATGFSDSWNEFDAAGWISAADWKTQTHRDGMHTRMGELAAVDTALHRFEQEGMAALPALKTAFSTWVAHNPKQVAARNSGHVVTGLGGFLGVPVPG